MNKLRIILVALILMMVSSCQTTLKDERANLQATQIVYQSLVKQVIALRKADKIADDDFANAKLISAAIKKNLTLWNDAVQAGKTHPELADVIRKNIEIFTSLLSKHKENE